MAAEIKQKLGFDATNAINSLSKLQQAMNNANQAMKNFGESARVFNANAAPMLAMMERMARAAVKISGALDRMGISAKKATAATAGLGKPQGFAANMQRFDALAKSLKQQQAQQRQPAPQQQQLLNPPVEKVKQFGSAWQDVGNLVKGLVIHRAISAITNAIIGSVEEARKFGLVIAEIQTLAEPLGSTNAELSREVITLSNALGKSATDVAEGLYQTLSNQVVDAADAFRFLEKAQRLAIATSSTTEESVDALSSVINSYSLGIEDAGRVSGQLFEIVNLGRVRLNEIADRIGRITPMAAQMGVSFSEVGAAIATMTVQGLKADTAITQLRAIMSKLQKPTEALKKVFRSWGVEDGPEALRTFGGLAGVLRKLSLETGGSSSEMSEFFNVVRAMTGVMGLATDEGKLFADNIKAIENASEKATIAFGKFLKTDAYSYTKQINELKNSILQLGQALLPVANLAAKAFNMAFGNVGEGIRVIEAWFSEQARLRGGFEEYEKRLAKAREEREKAFTRFDGQEWQLRERAARQGLASVGREFNSLFAEIEAGEKASTEVFKSFTKDIERNYETALTQLKDFSEKAADRIRENDASIRDSGDSISDVRFDSMLDRAQSSYQKMNLLMNRAGGQLNEALIDAWNAGTDPEKFKLAMERFKRAESSAKSALSGASNQQERARAEQLLITIYEHQLNLRTQYNKKIKDGIGLSEQGASALTAKGETLKELIKAYGEAQVAEQQAETPAQKEAAKKQREALKKTITELDFGPEADIMSKLGLDPASLKRLNFQLKDTFNLKEIEWQGAQESLQAALEKAQFRARVTMDPQIAGLELEKLGKEMGVEPKDNPAAFDQAAITRAKELNKKEKELQEGLKLQTETRVTKEKEYAMLLQQTIYDLLPAMQGQLEKMAAKNATAKAVPYTNKGSEALKKELEGAKLVEQQVLTTVNNLDKLAQQVEDGIPASADQLKVLNDELLKLEGMSGVVPANINTAIQELGTYLRAASKALEEAERTRDQLESNAGAFKAAKTVVERIEALGGNIIELQKKLDAANLKIDEGATGFSNQATEVYNTQEAVRVLEGETQALLTPIKNATTAYNQMAVAARSAAAAGATATKTAYAGGPVNFLAAGGRGQDKYPSMLAAGEFVMNSRSAGRFFSELNAMNSGSRPVYREQGGPVTNVGDVNVTVKGGDTAQATVREIGQALRREIQRGTIKLK